jgi:putative ABC transport system ATP-binding protein
MISHDRVLLSAADVVRVLGHGPDAFEVVIEEIKLIESSRVAIVGPSGSGKSTALALLALAMRPDRASVFVLNPPGSPTVDVGALWAFGRHDALAHLRARMLGFVPQVGGLLPFLTLRANIELTRRFLEASASPQIERLAQALEIDTVLDRLPGEISVGQRQRAAVLRALAKEPPIVLADEPTAAVHPAQAQTIMALLTDAAAHGNAALVVATHDLDLAVAAGLTIVPIHSAGLRSTLAWTGA